MKGRNNNNDNHHHHHHHHHQPTRREVGLSVVLLLLVCFCWGPVGCEAIAPGDLAGTIDEVIAQPQFQGSLWGVVVEVQNETTGEWTTLYSRNADQFFQPASNNKLLTTSAALIFFGLYHTIETPFLLPSSSAAEVDSACIVGAGDASLDETSLESLIANLQMLNPKLEVIEQLYIDDTLFPPFPSSWAWEDIIADYGAAPNSIVFNENVIQVNVTPGSSVGEPAQLSFNPAYDLDCIPFNNQATTVPDDSPNTLDATYSFSSPNPATLLVTGGIPLNATSGVGLAAAAIQPTWRFGCVLQYLLQRANISVFEILPSMACPLNSTNSSIAMVASPTLNSTMYYTLQVSDNLYAESFLRLLGANYPPAYPGIDAQSNGILAVQDILSMKLGVNTSLFHQVDGSGLSRENLVSPEALIQTLKAMDATPYAKNYITFLPVAGESGTLAGRYIGTTAQGVLHAKTGTLTGVCALSGFVLVPGSPKVAFSIIVNDGSVLDSEIEAGIDQIGVMLSQLEYDS